MKSQSFNSISKNSISRAAQKNLQALDWHYIQNAILCIRHLEYAAVVWSPDTTKEWNILDKVQRRATELVPRLRNESYNHRLSVLWLTTLTERRRRGDMIQFYKTSNYINKVDLVRSPQHCNSLLESGPAQCIIGHKEWLSCRKTSSRITPSTNETDYQTSGKVPAPLYNAFSVPCFGTFFHRLTNCKCASHLLYMTINIRKPSLP